MLTAGHCCPSLKNGSSKIVAGDHDTAVDEGTEQAANVTKIIIHPKFQVIHPFEYVIWDACILKLDKELEMNQYVQPVALPEPDEEFSGCANVSGWGLLTEEGKHSHVLQVVKVRVYNMQECLDAYPDFFKESNMICAGTRSKGTCHGDSGGPMVCGGKLCGIISWGFGCAREGLPGVYTNVAKIIDFINENIKKPY